MLGGIGQGIEATAHRCGLRGWNSHTAGASGEVKLGLKNHMSCCPICTYIVKNDYSFLNHIVIRHYWSSFSCGKCLEFTASSRQQWGCTLANARAPRRSLRRRRNAPSIRRPRCKAATSPKARNMQWNRKTSVTQKWSHTGRPPNLLPKLPLQNTLQALCVAAHASLNPVLPRRDQRNAWRSRARSSINQEVPRHPETCNNAR